MKTTIDIPEALYKKAKIRAIEQGRTLRQVVLDSLTKEIEGKAAPEPKQELSFLEKRKLLPAYEAALKAGAFWEERIPPRSFPKTAPPVKTLYFDTSYLCRVYTMEPGHDAVKGLLQHAGTLVTAWHGRAEFAAVLLRKRREGSDSAGFLNSLDRQFQRDCQTGLIQILSLTDAVMHRLESTLRKAPSETFLRAADAMHLACAAEHGFAEVYSNDRHFLAAAPLFGLKGINIIGTEGV